MQSVRSDLPDMVTALLRDALRAGATDIHLDSRANGMRICFRVDGVIHEDQCLSSDQGRHLINQIKVAAQLSPNRFTAPEESRLAMGTDDQPDDVRVTITPTVAGEAAHLRLLSQRTGILPPAELGLSHGQLEVIRRRLRSAEGLVLISGPTGAGKTMTLYSLVSLLQVDSLIAGSIEDPVEFDLPHVRQMQVDNEKGLTLYTGLRTMLRMDPDILLVGEIRDEASAVTSVRAAASGRFVLATIHAREAALAITACRLYGVPSNLLGTTLRLVIAQRLVRRICPNCGGRRAPKSAEKRQFTSAGLTAPRYVPKVNGCSKCRHYGYRGRVAVFEVVPTTEVLRDAMAKGRSDQELRRIVRRGKFRSLRRDALQKVRDGITSMEEVTDLFLPGGFHEE